MNEEKVSNNINESYIDKSSINLTNLPKRNLTSLTPSPGSKKPYINKFPIDNVAEFDDIVNNTNSNKLSLTSKINRNKITEAESLSGKMPNFVRFCDDLIDLIKVDSKDKSKQDTTPKRERSETSNIYLT